MAEIFDKGEKKYKPGILFLESPFKDVLIMIEKSGECKIITSPRFIKNDEEWNNLLQKRVEDIIKSL